MAAEKLIVDATMLAGTVLRVEWPVMVRGQRFVYAKHFGATLQYVIYAHDKNIRRSWLNGQYFIDDWEFDSREDAKRFAKAIAFMTAEYEHLQDLWRLLKAYRITFLVTEANGQPLNVLVDDKEFEQLKAKFVEHGFRVKEVYYGC